MKIFISPHNDDETLFGAFTIMANRSDIRVVVVYDSYEQVRRGDASCEKGARRAETIKALSFMGISPSQVDFLGLNDAYPTDIALLVDNFRRYRENVVWAPKFEEGGNRHHNAVAKAVEICDLTTISYLTYTVHGKSTSSCPVTPASWKDVRSKLLALSCYESQIRREDCLPHFLRSQEEYLAT